MFLAKFCVLKHKMPKIGYIKSFYYHKMLIPHFIFAPEKVTSL